MTPLDLALSYTAQGFTVLPVDPRTKVALTKNWTNKPEKGEPGSSKDPVQVEAWWTQWPDACTGLRTGKINGIVVVDVDRHGVSDGFKTIKAFTDIDPKATAAVLTPGTGQHLYYSYPGELKAGTLGAGVDFLAEGRQVIAPGSVRDGKPYLFINGHDLLSLQPLPKSVLAALKRSPGQKKLDAWSEKIRATPEGDRHNVVRDATWALAHDVVAGKLDEAEFRGRVADMARTCVPPYDRLVTEELIESALAKARSGKAGGGKAGGAASPSPVPDIEPWDEPVDGGQALNEAISLLTKYVLMAPAQRTVTAIWSLHTHLAEAFFHTPRVNVFSPSKRCGKSTLKRLVGGMVAKPAQGENISPAVIYHIADAIRPTFLFDEAHLLLSFKNHDRSALMSLMNAGFERTGAVWRMQGEGTAMAPKQFNVFSPMLLASIGRLGGSLGDRSIPIQLKRKLRSEAVEVFDFDFNRGELATVARKFARWAADNADAVRDARIGRDAFDQGWNDRECDCARPLLKIAAVLGDAWSEAVRNALSDLWRSAAAADVEDDDTLGPALLADIEAVFDDLYRDDDQRREALGTRSDAYIGSARLVELLVQDELKPWLDMGRGRPLTQAKLARMLHPYGISPQAVGPKTQRLKGYRWRQFTDAWRRYT